MVEATIVRRKKKVRCEVARISHWGVEAQVRERPEESVMVEKDWSVRETPGNVGEIKDTLFPLVLSAEIRSTKTIVSRCPRELYDDINEVSMILTSSLSAVSIGPLPK